jgi:aromatic-L-amino-acid/L-tryptophan decarboxylase
MDPVSVPHMTPEEFREHGYALVDWIAEYMREIGNLPVLSRAGPGEIRSRLPSHPPDNGEPFEDMLRDVDELIMPGLTHWQSPNFYAYFPANNSGPSILGELLSAGLGVQGMLWATSPACTELETHVLDWVTQLLDLPKAFRSDGTGGGVIQDTASSATLCALLAARERTTSGTSNRTGTAGDLTVYASSQAHSSVEKAVRIAGIGVDNLRLIEVDDTFVMDPVALDRAITTDRHDGRSPCMVVATIGTTSSMAVDPLVQIGAVCESHGVWLHVDAAMAGSAAICPEFRFLNDGLERADSYCFNPHKWLLVNFDCDCFYVADRSALIGALSVLPEYLRNTASESGAVIDYRDWQVPLGRRFRALKLWFVIRHYGAEGLRRHIRTHVDLSTEFAAWVETDSDFELAAPVMLNLVCFRHRAGDEFNERLLEQLNASGDLYLTHTKLDGRFTLRMAIGSPHTRDRHVRAAWDRIKAESAALRRQAGRA